MLRNHPYVQSICIEEVIGPDGMPERVLVVSARLRWSPHRHTNDNILMADLTRQLLELERLCRLGLMDYARVEMRPADLS